MPEKETLTIALSLKVAGFFLMLFAILSTFWWKLSSRFVNQKVCNLQTTTFADDLKRHEDDSNKQWIAITEARDASLEACLTSAATNKLLENMKSNQRKRKEDE